MARKRIEEPVLKSWDDVDSALMKIADCQRSIVHIEAKMNEQQDEIKKKADEKAKPYQDEIKVLELQIKTYVEQNRDDLGDKKTKELNFGKTGFQKSTKVSLPKAENKLLEVIRNLKVFGMTDCIVQQPEKIDKNALKKYPADDVIKVGASLKVNDTFWYEVNEDKLAE